MNTQVTKSVAALVGVAATIALGFSGAATASASPKPYPSGGANSVDLVEVTAQASAIGKDNGFTIRNVADRADPNAGQAQRAQVLPAGTQFVLSSNNFGNVALGDTEGYSVTLLTANGRDKVITLKNDIQPGGSIPVTLGKIQVSVGTTFNLKLADYSVQPFRTKGALDWTERANPNQTQYLANNSAGVFCLAAVAPVLSFCSPA
ncbi:putative protein OS=Tsukamurella paurometabola (strain ATCC 8368 / DSM / CCUG 35730 /CIP 100753 / JCM 10117 / KCTC 9821 / NBRC 16120 / NCIMB 702349/ NCTC 13040) OX=521096 GN=Tpau_0103 PE=4 SV=1 [Tsukamurella paurometabola]|uniref:Uncharacterized protein n=1 Tax=Tsukamurella paurometabola (strain ATCC 8368 / DSM 20162 / CCUG 35730 / CIP 100753 / JCM 10117 / KCTC 9821 / NBRC 16120 / NCIMB 702349 / NCTC 13040) TaxID=521096 RepID=D5UPY9_TSUPD|nr:hypothetical protein [Tsukamurella paurometabola]ADG76757.1 hypothetical protein Tpau_0103 [Tsukamurella paurometabola DSM 20162]SUP41496.1 Uncharacterised protein [Tsukamurella paurometabola]